MYPGQFLTVVAAVALAGCPAGSECDLDWDCGSGEVCANTHECLTAGEVRRVEINWTLFGAPASAGTCEGVDRMELTARNAATDDNATYSPVPCATGRFVFDKLPFRFDSVAMSAFVFGTFAEAQQAEIPENGNVTLDFAVGSVVDGGVPPDSAPTIDAGP